MGCCCFQNPRDLEEIDENLTDSRVRMAQTNQALTLKEQGNEHFKKKAYLNAIKCYTQALSKNPHQLVYYTNLALAYKANEQFQQGIKTIDRMHRQRFPATANYSDLIHKGTIIKARCIISLTKRYIISNDYTTQQSDHMLNLIQTSTTLLDQVKKSSSIDVDEYINNSLKIKIYLTKIKKKTSESQVVDYIRHRMNVSRRGLHNEKGWEKIEGHFDTQEDLLKEVEGLYSKLHAKFIQEAQDDEEYLVDPITYEKFKEPVIVPSGITYQEEILREYFKKGEYKDPITKEKFQVGEKVIVKNYSLQNYIREMGKIHEIKKEDIELLVC